MKFFDWVYFEEVIFFLWEIVWKFCFEKIFILFNLVKVEFFGYVSIEGFGGIVEMIYNFFCFVKKDDFMWFECIIYFFKLVVDKVFKWEFERLENEFFDLIKYNGDSCDYLIVVIWVEEGMLGIVIFFRVIFEGEDEIIGF